MRVEKNCINCTNGKFSRGYMETRNEPGWPDEIECQCKTVSDEIFENYDENVNVDFYSHLPSICLHYDPQMAGKCICCQHEINKPIIDSIGIIEFFSGELLSVCSKECEIVYKNTIVNMTSYSDYAKEVLKDVE